MFGSCYLPVRCFSLTGSYTSKNRRWRYEASSFHEYTAEIATSYQRSPGLPTLFATMNTDIAARYPSRIGRTTPRPSAKNHNAGAGVPTGRIRRSSRAAIRGSRMSQRV